MDIHQPEVKVGLSSEKNLRFLRCCRGRIQVFINDCMDSTSSGKVWSNTPFARLNPSHDRDNIDDFEGVEPLDLRGFYDHVHNINCFQACEVHGERKNAQSSSIRFFPAERGRKENSYHLGSLVNKEQPLRLLGETGMSVMLEMTGDVTAGLKLSSVMSSDRSHFVSSLVTKSFLSTPLFGVLPLPSSSVADGHGWGTRWSSRRSLRSQPWDVQNSRTCTCDLSDFQ